MCIGLPGRLRREGCEGPESSVHRRWAVRWGGVEVGRKESAC